MLFPTFLALLGPLDPPIAEVLIVWMALEALTARLETLHKD
jgi:hypothetical protein